MAYGSNETVIAMRKEEDELTDLDRQVIGQEWLRLEVPFHSTAKLRQWRELMAGYLAAVDFYLQPRAPGAPVVSERAKLFHLRFEASKINAVLRGKRAPGRPRKVPASGKRG